MMLLSLKIKRHAQASGAVNAPIKKDAPTHHTWLKLKDRLKTDVGYLRTLKGHQEKTPYKIHLIEKYQRDVDELLASHGDLSGLDVVWYWFMWACDVGRFEEVYPAFKAAIDKHLSTPNDFKSTGPTAFADIVIKHAQAQFDAERPYHYQCVFDVIDGIEAGNYAINLALKSKFYRLAGDIADRHGEPENALRYFEKLMQLDSKGGRKSKIAELNEKLSKTKG